MSRFIVFTYLCLASLIVPHCYGYPIDPGAMLASSSVGLACLAVVFLVLSVMFLIGCACCKQSSLGFKQFSNSVTSLHEIGFSRANRPELNNEVSIFPPPICHRLTPPLLLASPSPHPQSARPAAFASTVAAVPPDLSHWFVDPNGHVPRQQIFYQREIGKGWFGKVVEGETRGGKVVVRILREDSTPQEKSYFLQEAHPYRDLRHRNLLSLHGKSLQQEPYLLLFDFCTNGDLKSFLVTNCGSKAVLNEQGICLKMMTDIAEGLNYMLENNFIHTDLAARNCLVSSDLTIKIGDYGTSIDKYKDEYYITENVAIPIRWCAPETLHCTPTTIEAKQVTVEANVWSLGVVLWEIAEFGRLPYDELTDDQVIIRVFGSEKLRLPQPDCPYGVFLYNVLSLCWRVNDRAGLSQVLSMLYYLRTSPACDKQADFDARWSQTKPNSIPRVDNHPLANSREFDSGVDLEMKSCRSLTLSANSDDFLQSKKSASLTNLQGSLEDVNAVEIVEDSLAVDQEVRRPLVPSFRLGPLGGKSDSSSDTEEEMWRTRIERGEFTEKVKEKSKSVTDLMVLTHIDSEGSESDSLPSLQPKQKNNTCKQPAYTSIGFGSEGNIRDALLSEELQNALRQLTASWKPNDQGPFLGKAASETDSKCPPTVNKNRPLPPTPTVDNPVRSPSDEESKLNLVETEACSSHNNPDGIPQITVTEASFIDISNPEPETSQYIVDTKPRKLRIVCHSEDSEVDLADLIPSSDDRDSVSSETIFNVAHCKTPEISVDIIEPPVQFIDVDPDTPETFHNIVNSYESKQDEFELIHTEVEKVSFSDILPDKNDFITADGSSSNIMESVKTDDECQRTGSNQAEDEEFSAARDDGTHDDLYKLINETDAGEGRGDADIIKKENGDCETAVILGSCEDYTLEYFRGLKTTYAPPDSFSDGGSDRLEEVGEDSDFVNDESQTSQMDGAKVLDNCRLRPVRQDSNEDPYPDSMTASVTTASSSSGYATIEKDKIIRNEYNYIDESYSPSKDKLPAEDSILPEDFPVKDMTETFLVAEREMYCHCPALYFQEKRLCDVSLEALPSIDSLAKHPYGIDCCYSAYFSDSVEGLNNQQDEIKELKSRLEDAMKINNDYHLKQSDEEHAGKIVTPDDERSSDSGFRDKGSLSESAEDTCDEKYNLEDIDTELDDFTSKHFESQSGDETPAPGEGWFLHPTDKSSWFPESTEFDVRESVSLNADFINAIRCELREKLPQANISDLEGDDDSSPEEVECVEIETGVFTLPVVSQLSPILEERESNQSSLILDDASPLDTPDKMDLTFNSMDSPKTDCLAVDDVDENGFNEEDVLVVDVETNEATLIESPKAQTGLMFSSFQPLTGEEDTSEDTLENYAIHRESVGFTPDISLGSSSPDQGNLSGFFMSPCSVRSDLFDSGPPSLPFDITQSLEETDEDAVSPASLPDLVTSSMNNSAMEPHSPDTLKLYSPLDDSSSKSFDSTIKNTDISTEDNTLVSDNDNDNTVVFNESKKISDYFKQPEPNNSQVNGHNSFKEFLHFNSESIDNGDDWPEHADCKSSKSNCDELLDNMEEDKRNGNEDNKRKDVADEIDLLIMKNNNNSKVELPEEEEELIQDSTDGWLQEILAEKSIGLEVNGWPSAEELVVKPRLSSTIALASPGDSSESYPQMPLTPCSEPGDSNWRPTITQLMDLAANETDEMTTSFIEAGDGTVTPDWDSDSSESSSSGEFIWKEGDKEEGVSAVVLTQLSDSSEEGHTVPHPCTDEDDSDLSSEGGSCSSDFVPSTWDSSLTPSKSSIKSPSLVQIKDNIQTEPAENRKKKVVFKKEKYQCIYEYPREPSDDDEQDDHPSWQSSSTNSIYDYFDWELGENELNGTAELDSDTEEASTTAFQLDEGEFFSKCFGSGEKSSQFFPGELDDIDSSDEFIPLASDVSGENGSADSSEPVLRSSTSLQDSPTMGPPAAQKSSESQENNTESHDSADNAKQPTTETNDCRTDPSAPLGILRHTKDQLKLDLKPQSQPVIADIRGEANILESSADTLSAA